MSGSEEDCWGLVFSEECSGFPTGDPGVMESSEETSPPCGTSLLLGVEDFWALTALL